MGYVRGSPGQKQETRRRKEKEKETRRRKEKEEERKNEKCAAYEDKVKSRKGREVKGEYVREQPT